MFAKGISMVFRGGAAAVGPALMPAGVAASASSKLAVATSSAAVAAAPARGIATSRPLRGLDEFFTNQQSTHVGRPWACADLRVKSFEDLQKLWFVLLKEKNMLRTYRDLCRQNQQPMKLPERLGSVRQSMAAIKRVLAERSHPYKMNTSPLYASQVKKAVKRRLRVEEAVAARAPVRVAHNPEDKRGNLKYKWQGLAPRKPAAAASPLDVQPVVAAQ